MLLILYFTSFWLCRCVRSTTVEVEQGWLQGSIEQSLFDGSPYFSFKGIPYAKPPLGDLRFKAPEPPESWNSTRDATKHGSVCVQYNSDSERNEGSEDCLFLNVYTPNLCAPNLLPVIFFIHGGLYLLGSGNDDFYGPDIMVAQGVIVVTINYRLEVLGFLQLDIPDVSGNAGLKDQVAAMRWVQKNIRNFGGDPSRVTIMGQSVGGSSVGYHLMSQQSRGLFKRAIISSGVPITDFSTSFQCTRKALVLGTQLGYHTRDQYQLLQFLRTVPAERFINVNTSAIITESIFKPALQISSFLPCPETCGNNRFLTGNILEDLINGNIVNKVDVMIGHTNIETLSQIYQKKVEFFEYYTNFTDLFVPVKMLYQITPQQTIQAADRIIKFYFGNNYIVPENIRDMLRYADAEIYFTDIYRYLNYLPNCMRKFVYIMEAYSERNINGKEASEYYGIEGTVHRDDLNYLFQPKMGKRSPPLKPGSREYNLVKEYSRAFINFIKNGNPGVNNWRPYDVTRRNAAPSSSSTTSPAAPLILPSTISGRRLMNKLASGFKYFKSSLPSTYFSLSI